MEEDNPSRTDAELTALLDEPGGWMVRVGGMPAVPQGSHCQALRQAFDLSAQGLAITHIVKLPDDTIVISATQIQRLWQMLRLLKA